MPKLAERVFHAKLGSDLRARRTAGGAGARSLASRAGADADPRRPRGAAVQGRPDHRRWSASSPSCRASWAATTRCTTASRPRWRTPSPSTTRRRARPTAARRRRSASPWHWPTSSTRWSASSRSTRSRPARRIRSRCAAPALGVIRLIVENRLRLPLRRCFSPVAYLSRLNGRRPSRGDRQRPAAVRRRSAGVPRRPPQGAPARARRAARSGRRRVRRRRRGRPRPTFGAGRCLKSLSRHGRRC